jgi:hypothetical protein
MYEMEGPRSAVRPRPADCSANMSRVARHRCRAPVLSSGCPALRTFPGLPRSRCPSSVAPPGPRTRPRAPVARRWRTSRGCPRSVPVLGGPPPPQTPPEHRFPGSPDASGVAPRMASVLGGECIFTPPGSRRTRVFPEHFQDFLAVHKPGAVIPRGWPLVHRCIHNLVHKRGPGGPGQDRSRIAAIRAGITSFRSPITA